MESDLTASDVNWRNAARGAIEYRIRQRKANITHEFYGMGDDLNEAKERGVVQHGDWEAWATEVTGLNIRTVQRLMQAAREVPPDKRLDTSLGKLEFRQLSAVLALPPEEREAMADRAVTEEMSSRAVEEAVKAANLKAQYAEAARDAARVEAEAQRKRAHDIEINLEERAAVLAETMISREDEMNAALTLEKNEAQQRAQQLQRELSDAKQREAEAAKALDVLKTTLADKEKQVGEPPSSAELMAARAQIREQARLRQEAQQQLLALQSQMAHGAAGGDVAVGLTVSQFSEAARAFVGRCGALPHMHAQLAVIRQRERDEWLSAVAMVQRLLDGAREALNCVDGGESHE